MPPKTRSRHPPKRDRSPSPVAGPSCSTRSKARQPTPLPASLTQQPEEETQSSINLAKAIAKIDAYKPADRGDHDNDLVGRTLHAFLEHLPDDGIAGLVHDINESNDNDKLYGVFLTLYNCLIKRMFVRSRPATDTPSPNDEEIISTGSRVRDSSFAEKLLKRDAYRCVVTKAMNRNHYLRNGSPDDVEEFMPTIGAHILPFCLGHWNENKGLPKDVSNSWEVIWRCFPAVKQMLHFDHKNINDLANGLTLASWTHDEFGAFRIAFKPTDIDNVYEIEKLAKISKTHDQLIQDEITFENNGDETERELPSPILLDVHRRLAHIVSVSGLGEAIQHDSDKWEVIQEHAAQQGLLNSEGLTDLERILGAHPSLEACKMWCADR